MNVVVVAPNWLGDAVMALPALADLRRHFAAARLTVAARTSVAALFDLVPGVDAVLALPGRGGLAGLTTWRRDASALGRGGFDLAVLFPNSFASAWMVERAGVPERWGLATDWRSRLLTRTAPRPRHYDHQASYYQALVAALGIANGPAYARVDVPADTDGGAPATPYVVFAPGAAYGSAKQWPVERFAELAGLVREQGLGVVLVGSAADRSTCARIAAQAARDRRAPSAPGVLDLAGRTTLAQLAAVLARAGAVVSNDSGAMHLAGAVGAPVVAVFGATNEHRTSPLARDPDAPAPRVIAACVWCRPCMLRECPIDHRCMRNVTARQVADAVGAAVRPRGAGAGERVS